MKKLLISIIVVVSSLCSFFAVASSASPSSSNDDDDLQTLVCLKLHLSSSGGSPTTGALDTWNRNNGSIGFCRWPGVTCRNERVAALDLESWGLDGVIPPCIANLTLLTRIHLPNNRLTGGIPPELGRLGGLRYLNLSGNALTGTIPSALSSASSLRVIDVGGNSLSGAIPDSLGTLPQIAVLHLAGNGLTDGIPPSLGTGGSLTSLILTNNSLTGTIPASLASSSRLEVLDLTNNNLGGTIPPGLLNISSLVRLSLGWNFFVGPIPTVPPSLRPRLLQSLVLSVNRLTGTVPPSLGNLTSLRRLLLSSNNLRGSLPASISRIPNLQQLDVSYNNLSGDVPPSLYNMSALADLRLAINGFTGSLPPDMGRTLPSIRSLIFQGNSFRGRIPDSLGNATNLEFVNLAQSAFTGVIPSTFGSLPQLNQLILAANRLEAEDDWTFLSALTNCTRLEVLSLGTNNLRGTLPARSIGRLAPSLRALLLHANAISGAVPPEMGNLTGLTFLRMEDNSFTGPRPATFPGDIANLTFLDLSRNKLSGRIPSGIGNLRQLNKLFLQENNFTGPIPAALGDCDNLILLNISRNSLSGTVPRELFSLRALSAGLDLSRNQLSGEIPREIGGLINLGHLNFSDNRLSGPIPTALGFCVLLETLRLEGNSLDGAIPASFASLRGITEMDLSRNNLSGAIPTFFQSLGSLKLLNLSFNNLDGPVPNGGVFLQNSSSEVFLQGNPMLCSTTSPTTTTLLQLPLCRGPPSSQHRRSSVILGISLAAALALVCGLSCVTARILYSKRRRKRSNNKHHSGQQQVPSSSFNEMRNFSYDELVRATDGFSSHNLLGSGTYGSVYKGELEEDMPIAVKVFKLGTNLGAPKSFVAECAAFRNIRHRNIVRVISACSTWDHGGNDFKALIVEYMANGTLDNWLHYSTSYSETMETAGSPPLSLGSRVAIAADVASALDYLHNRCVPPIVHCDLKPSNVLLDDGMGARLGDFGLAKFLNPSSSNSTASVGPRGSIGYIAPEYGLGSKASTEGDVYSYGILVLEMLTGKRPTDELFSNDGLSLREFVGNAFPFPQRIVEILLDPNIIIHQSLGAEGLGNHIDRENHKTAGLLNCVTELFKLGLSCSAEAPKDRPTMVQVCVEANAIRQAISALCVE